MFDSFMLAHDYNKSHIYLLLYVDDTLITVKSKKEITTLKQ
jgi:hypothetical protein